MPALIGADCKLYRNTGTYGTPVWDLIDIVKDVTLSLESGEADATSRATNGWKVDLPGLKSASVEFDVVWDTGNTDFTTLQTAWLNKTSVDIAVLDGLAATAGSQGLRAPMGVFSFSRKESLEEAVMASVKLKPMYGTNAPVWMTVP